MNHTDILGFTVYDVSSKESFDALPRWFTELETYVSGSVVKILVGNKVDKVCTLAATAMLVIDRSLILRNFHGRCQQRRLPNLPNP
jgi:GTPase SAR1 family protein